MIKRIWKNTQSRKYFIVLVVFVLWIIFFDNNSLYKRRAHETKLEQLLKDKAYYQKRIIEDSIQLYELKNNPEKLEEFARENYYMKRPDEEIFVIKEVEKK